MKHFATVCTLIAVGWVAQANAGPQAPSVGMAAWEAYEYGRSYLRINPPSPSTAAKYFVLAAEMGDKWAAYELAELYRTGNGVQKDLSEAVRLYETIVDDNGWAQYQLGEMLRKGEGVAQDPVRARELLESAVIQTYSHWPKFALAQILEASEDQRDVRRAVRLYREAVSEDNPYASERYANLCSRVSCP
jgi:TPR repeat protein